MVDLPARFKLLDVALIDTAVRVVAHRSPANWTVYLLIYVEILGKSFGKFIWDFIWNLALILINMWSGGRLKACQSRRKMSSQ